MPMIVLTPVSQVRQRRWRRWAPTGVVVVAGVAAVAVVVVVVLRHRLVTAVTVLALLVGSALHHEVADVEHLLVFTTTLLVAPVLLRRRAGTRSRAER